MDQIIPHLAEMQSLLSQRGRARKKVLNAARLPSWPEYGKAYAAKLECSFRTIQGHITGLKRNGKRGPSTSTKNSQQGKRLGKRPKPWHAGAKDPRALDGHHHDIPFPEDDSGLRLEAMLRLIINRQPAVLG